MCAIEQHRYFQYFRRHAAQSTQAILERVLQRFVGRVGLQGEFGRLHLEAKLAS